MLQNALAKAYPQINSPGAFPSKESVLLSLKQARCLPLESCSTPFLLPVVKLTEKKTHDPWEKAACPAVVIKAQDLLNRSGLKAKPIFEQIRKAGGIHPYLGFNGNIILSSIMRDQTIRGFTAEAYAEIIQTLEPDYYITPDGETYFGEPHQSEHEIKRMLRETAHIMSACPKSRPLGLVKGCNIVQIEKHTDCLLELGVSMFVFHAGDFICRGNNYSISQAIVFANLISKRVPSLIVYGVGANSHFRRFNLADGFITQSHFVNAFYGQKMVCGRWRSFKGTATREIIMQNLCALEDNLLSLRCQRGLLEWMEPNEVGCLPMAVRIIETNNQNSLKLQGGS